MSPDRKSSVRSGQAALGANFKTNLSLSFSLSLFLNEEEEQEKRNNYNAHQR